MEQRRVGRTGLHVSLLGLGTMSWGLDTDAQDAGEQLRDFCEAGGTFVDTAASYSSGASEEIIGTLLGAVVGRDEVVLCTKGGIRATPSGRVVDASRGGLIGSLDASLKRLGTDHVDLYLVQAPDPHTPLEETVSAMRHIVTSGRARYVGLSNHTAWQTGFAAAMLPAHGDAELAAVEVEHSLLERAIERDVVPAVEALGTGLVAWSALGRGVLTGKYRRSLPADSRGASRHLAGFVEPYLDDRASSIVDAVCTAAHGLGRAPLEVALAWVLERPYVACALVGARTPAQLREALSALDLDLPHAVATALDDVSSLDSEASPGT
ncbi:aldo/keto reductase [Sanguibacter antarcticus]|uniref:Aryl-alcohol dehydrogenase-like predicted oxidoreductase n=1 Tax=Sanguibacter antarcticus TaxID=372484 RepID=A0A2A9E3A9_9MICO|nr:aldo/keto reductase [Sanguibacter antarcticus]PFG33324.1 aryl-alcohol dehydrogenase-like predicted oxidoreductase [Sanguibacter antarcticus]